MATASDPSGERTGPSVGAAIGNYRLTRELGRGGMGVVFAGEHQAISAQQVAIKVLLPALSAQRSYAHRFRNEAQAAASLKHPGLVRIYDFGETAEGDLYIIMELLHGDPLDERQQRQGRPFTEAETQDLGGQIAAALKAVHDGGIVHRERSGPVSATVEGGGGTAGDPFGRRLEGLEQARPVGRARHPEGSALHGTQGR